MDYLGARRPVLGIVDPLGEMAHLGESYGDMRVVPAYEEALVAAAVETLLISSEREPSRPGWSRASACRDHPRLASRTASALLDSLVDAAREK